MKNRSLRLPITLFIFALIASIGAWERPAYAQCEKGADTQIVADIYAKIKADKGLAPQISHINVVSVNSAAKFQGWADSKKDYDRIVGFASETKCVRLVNVNNFAETPPAAGNALRAAGGCTSGTKQCGDVCIPENEICNITEFMGINSSFSTFDLTAKFEIFDPIFGCF